MRGLKLRNLCFGPSVKALDIAAAIRLHTERRIAGEQANRDGMAENRTQHLE